MCTNFRRPCTSTSIVNDLLETDLKYLIGPPEPNWDIHEVKGGLDLALTSDYQKAQEDDDPEDEVPEDTLMIDPEEDDDHDDEDED